MFTGERVELIEGHILALSPHNPTHSNAVTRSTGVLVRAFPLAVPELAIPVARLF